MPEPVWTVGIDLNGSGTYSGGSKDISTYLMDLDVQQGFATPYDAVARDSTATLTLLNSDKRFSPESANVFSACFTRGKKLQVTVGYSASSSVLYTGWIDSIQPGPGQWRDRTVTLKCSSFFQRAQGIDSFVPVQVNKTADTVLGAIVGPGGVYPPGIANRWLLGIPGRGELGTNTLLGAASDYLTAETGLTTFSYIGDQWGNGVSVTSAMKDTVGREYGRLYLTRAGLLQFTNRTHLNLNSTVNEAFTNAMTGLAYDYGSEVMNRVTVRARPRKVGSAPEVLGRLDAATLVKTGTAYVVRFRYADLSNSGAKIAGQNAITPVQTTDFLANTASDGTGTNKTTSVTAVMTAQSATGTEVTYTNAAGVDVYLLAGAQIRGTAIRDFGQMDYVYNDAASQTAYGLIPYTYPYESDNLANAEGVARYLGTSRQTARGQAKSITVSPRASVARIQSAINRTVFDRITVTETQTGAATDYFIISEHHRAQPHKYEVTYGLEPAGTAAYWLLGVAGRGELGTNTYLGPF